MVRNFVMTCLIMIFTTALVYAVPPKQSDLVGKWAGVTERQDGNRESTLTFTMEGKKLTGETAGGQGRSASLNDITLEDDGTITWSITFTRNGQDYALPFTGKLDGPEITGNYDFFGRGTLPFTASKMKSDK
jgi:hypothetical protein